LGNIHVIAREGVPCPTEASSSFYAPEDCFLVSQQKTQSQPPRNDLKTLSRIHVKKRSVYLGNFYNSSSDKENLTMNRPSSLLILAGALSFCAALFQAVIAIVPEWSAAFGAGDALVSNPPLLLALGLLVALLLVIFGLYGLSGAGVIRQLPLLRLGLLAIGLLYSLVGINFPFQVLALLGILPSAGPIPIYTLLVSFGAFVAALAYLIGLALSWKRLSTRPAPAVS
jgi:hypothetical protein